jgi:hypothetical protein
MYVFIYLYIYVFLYVCMYVLICVYVRNYVQYIYVFTYMYIHLQSSSETKHQFEILFSLPWNRGFDSRAAHVECVVDKVTIGQGIPESFGFPLSVSF